MGLSFIRQCRPSLLLNRLLISREARWLLPLLLPGASLIVFVSREKLEVDSVCVAEPRAVCTLELMLFRLSSGRWCAVECLESMKECCPKESVVFIHFISSLVHPSSSFSQALYFKSLKSYNTFIKVLGVNSESYRLKLCRWVHYPFLSPGFYFGFSCCCSNDHKARPRWF